MDHRLFKRVSPASATVSLSLSLYISLPLSSLSLSLSLYISLPLSISLSLYIYIYLSPSLSSLSLPSLSSFSLSLPPSLSPLSLSLSRPKTGLICACAVCKGVFSFLCSLYVHCPSKIKVAHSSFALIMECICCAVVSIYFHPELHSFLAEILHWWQESRTVPSVFSFNPKWWPIHVWKWLLLLPDTHVSSCSTLSQLEPDESWHCRPGICRSHQGRETSIDGITWSFSTFRNSAELLCLDLTNWSNPDHSTTICWTFFCLTGSVCLHNVACEELICSSALIEVCVCVCVWGGGGGGVRRPVFYTCSVPVFQSERIEKGQGTWERPEDPPYGVTSFSRLSLFFTF